MFHIVPYALICTTAKWVWLFTTMLLWETLAEQQTGGGILSLWAAVRLIKLSGWTRGKLTTHRGFTPHPCVLHHARHSLAMPASPHCSELNYHKVFFSSTDKVSRNQKCNQLHLCGTNDLMMCSVQVANICKTVGVCKGICYTVPMQTRCVNTGTVMLPRVFILPLRL